MFRGSTVSGDRLDNRDGSYDGGARVRVSRKSTV